MLQRLGYYVLKNRQHAIWIALCCAVFSFFGLPTFDFALLMIAFITLFKGSKEGFIVLAWVALPGFAWAWLGEPEILVGSILVRGLVIWGLASFMYYSASWIKIIYSAALLGIIAVAIFHCFVPDTANWWLIQLQKIWGIVGKNAVGDNGVIIQNWMNYIAPFATGILASGILIFNLLILMLARGWQAKLMNPGGLGKELRTIQLHRFSCILLAVVIGLGLSGFKFADDIAAIALLPFAIAGLSVIHARLALYPSIKTPILIGLYITMLLFLPYVSAILGLVGVVDSWLDFRALRQNTVSMELIR